MQKTFLMATLALFVSGSQLAHADGRPLIWSVSRIGDNGVKFRTGLRWPTAMEPSAGITTQVDADENGAISAVPVSVWTSLLIASQETAASKVSTLANMNYDAISRRAEFLVSEKRSWIETAAMDVVTRRSVGLAAGGDTRIALAASQSLRLEFPALNVAFAATGSADTNARTFTKSLSVEKALFRRMKVTANISESDRVAAAGLRLDYSIKW
jgi:hypothetical protein